MKKEIKAQLERALMDAVYTLLNKSVEATPKDVVGIVDAMTGVCDALIRLDHAMIDAKVAKEAQA